VAFTLKRLMRDSYCLSSKQWFSSAKPFSTAVEKRDVRTEYRMGKRMEGLTVSVAWWYHRVRRLHVAKPRGVIIGGVMVSRILMSTCGRQRIGNRRWKRDRCGIRLSV